jgi:hypothetical protein
VTSRKQFLLRIDPELWKQLEAWAGDELRSVNAQGRPVRVTATARHFGRRSRAVG